MSDRIIRNIEELVDVSNKNIKLVNDILKSDILSDKKENLVDEEYKKIIDIQSEINKQSQIARNKKTIVMFGSFSTGKSTIINGYLGLAKNKNFDLLPAQDDPTTALPVRFTYAASPEEEGAEIILSPEESQQVSIEEAYRYITESDNSEQNIQEILLKVHHPQLIDTDLVDLPGRGAAFFEEHEHIVKNRMKDGSIIFWIHGGLDQQFPGNEDLKLIKNLPGDSNREVIPIWNAKQFKDKKLSECSKKERETLEKDAERNREELSQILTGRVTNDVLVIWGKEAELNSDDGIRVSNINTLLEFKEKLIFKSESPEVIAIDNLVDSRKNLRECNNEIKVQLLREINDTKDEKRAIRQGISLLDYSVFESKEIVRKTALNVSEDIVENKIQPALMNFIDEETSIGGVIHSAWESKSSSAAEFKEKMESNLKQRLDKTLNFGDSNNGWLAKTLKHESEDLQNSINREYSTLETRLLNELNLSFFDSFEHEDNEESYNKPDEDWLVASISKNVSKNLATIAAAISSAIITLIIIVMPKTGTPVDILAAVFGGFAGITLLSTLKGRMKGHVRSAAWEIGVHIKDAIRTPALKYVKKWEEYFTKILNIASASDTVTKLNNYKNQVVNINDELTAIDLDI